MPGQVPPDHQEVQAPAGLAGARHGEGSLNRSKTTASLPLKVFATDVQNGIAWAASGIGFWQVAVAAAQPDELPVYTPSVQCRSRIATRPLEFSRLTYALIALM